MEALYIDRSKPEPGRLFEDVSEDDLEEISEQPPGDYGKFFDNDILKPPRSGQLPTPGRF